MTDRFPCRATPGWIAPAQTATLSSSLDCPPFAGIDLVAKPIVRVALDPVSILDMPALKQGMKRLHQVCLACG